MQIWVVLLLKYEKTTILSGWSSWLPSMTLRSVSSKTPLIATIDFLSILSVWYKYNVFLICYHSSDIFYEVLHVVQQAAIFVLMHIFKTQNSPPTHQQNKACIPKFRVWEQLSPQNAASTPVVKLPAPTPLVVKQLAPTNPAPPVVNLPAPMNPAPHPNHIHCPILQGLNAILCTRVSSQI